MNNPKIDWSNSQTSPTDLWKNELLTIEDRLLIADGAVAWHREVIKNLRKQLEECRSSNN